MRVLFTVIAGNGHFHPLVPIAKALQAAGHDVRFATAPPFAAQVEASGFHCIPAGIDFHQVEVEIPELRTLPPLARRDMYRQRIFPEISPQRLLPALLALRVEWPPDLVVSDNMELAGRVAAESWGIPHAAMQVANAYTYTDRLALVPQMDALRASVGLPPDPDGAMLFRYLYFVCDPPQFQPVDVILPPTAHRLRRAIFDRSGDETVPSWVADLPAQSTVFATLGTAFNHTPGVFSAILDDLRDEPLNLILTVGRDRDPTEFGPQPTTVHIERYIPQSLILPACDLVVSHCGSGTMLAALDQGLPLVNVPIGADQPENAARCDALGVSMTVPAGQYRPGAIRAAVYTVLTDRSYRANAERVRDVMAAWPGPEHAVELLERLAIDKQPMPQGGNPSVGTAEGAPDKAEDSAP